MKFFICIAFIITNTIAVFAQVNFKTIVPETVIVGDAFPVQYVLENVPSDSKCTPPVFKNFKLISGPSVHNGNNGYPLKNTVYTLEAIKPGKFVIEGASVDYNGTGFKSNNVTVEVITKAEAFKRGILTGEAPSNSDLYLKPGEDPYKKINNNLFVKLITDRQSCYVGEPVTATFKLYSRLQSTSDIVKNPGFYGFSVYDITGIKDNKTVQETVDGKQYDVHIIRKVQLYPLKAGSLIIDEMEIENTIVFTDSPALRKVKQQIIEGVVTDKNNSKKSDAREYTNSIHTQPVTVQVKATPAANKPADFTGATGYFKIKAGLSNNELAVNEQAELIVTVSGKGNFTQLTAPTIEWPAGVEGLEPTVSDSLDNNFSPLKGSRIFHYPFVVSKAGKYNLPALKFSFFNPDTNAYKQITTSTISFLVKQDSETKKGTVDINKSNTASYFLPGVVSVTLITALLLFLLWRIKMRKVSRTEEHNTELRPPSILTVAAILQPAFTNIQSNDIIFYSSLRQCIWNYFSQRLGISTTMTNAQLVRALSGKTDDSMKREIEQLLIETETNTYGGISSANDKKVFYQRTLNLLERIDAVIRK